MAIMKTVQIAELKARLSEYLRGVRAGQPLTVLDRKTPVARIVPVGDAKPRLTIRKADRKAPAFGSIRWPTVLSVPGDIVDVLLEERENSR